MPTNDSKLPKAGDEAHLVSDRRTLVRDAFVLQLKLVLDGLRDLLLVPASIVAAIISLIDSSKGRPGSQFYDLLAIGKRSERWIDLFGALRDHDESQLPEDGNIDRIVDRMEAFVVDEYRRGGITRQAKDRLDQALAALQRKQQ